ncbi:hypothetical protein OHA72_35465 [Dactylosporangium sp. NBC_01737]|uniref:hypothetical protein n=1 Tax=Dactylosporangium sp. NBC_01737 TaxID=2975959 RepID=UPI002E0FA795|nr:hypothetical protein OHA72_35465 [Dactylosporangium sp. NBC_01737]
MATAIGLIVAVAAVVQSVVPFASLTDKVVGVLAVVLTAWLVQLARMARMSPRAWWLAASTAALGLLMAVVVVRAVPPTPASTASPTPQASGSSAVTGSPGVRRTGEFTLFTEPNGHGVDLDSDPPGWDMDTCTRRD